MMTSKVKTGSSRASAATTRATSETRKARPPPPPSRLLAPPTTSLITTQPTTAPIRQKRAPRGPLRSAVPESKKPTISPITAANKVIRPRADPRVPVVPASMPIAMPMPSSSPVPSRKLTSKTYTPWMEETPHRRRAHTRTRDLERYAGLFAARTGVMRSSAMRDLMAITARPEVISLAGGLPDTSTFPPQSFAAQMTRIAQESAAKALQYGPTEGFEETKACIVDVMAAEGMRADPED